MKTIIKSLIAFIFGGLFAYFCVAFVTMDWVVGENGRAVILCFALVVGWIALVIGKTLDDL